MKGTYQKFTPIQDLPELRQIDPIQQSVAQPEYGSNQGEVHPKLQRFIRAQSHGMPTHQQVEYYEQDSGNFQPMDESYSGQSNGSTDLSRGYRSKQVPDNLSPPLMSNMEPYESVHSHYNCKDLYEHVKECEICKRFYKRDNTVYIIIIAILIIACALLAKKVMNV